MTVLLWLLSSGNRVSRGMRGARDVMRATSEGEWGRERINIDPPPPRRRRSELIPLFPRTLLYVKTTEFVILYTTLVKKKPPLVSPTVRNLHLYVKKLHFILRHKIFYTVAFTLPVPIFYIFGFLLMKNNVTTNVVYYIHIYVYITDHLFVMLFQLSNKIIFYY